MGSASHVIPPPEGTLNEWLSYVIMRKVDALSALLNEKSNPFAMERVHKLRVTARRLEAVLRIFEDRFPRKKVRGLRDELRGMIGYLGKVREYDVMLEMLEERSGTLRSHDRLVLGILLARISMRQNKASRRLRAYLKTQATKGLKRQARELTATLSRKGTSSGSRRRTEVPFRDAMREVVPRLYGEFTKFEERVLDHPKRLEEFHDMRLAGKPLRYMMEIVLPVAGAKAKNCLREIVALVTEMGAIHDHDVAIAAITDYLDEVSSYDPAMKKGVGVLYRILEEQRRRRELLFRKLCASLLRWERANFRSALIQSIA